MNIDACKAFAEAIDVQLLYVQEPWVRGRCPMSWMHKRGFDLHPSFGIRANDEGTSFYNCFVHGAGSLPKLLHSLQLCHKEHFKEASRILTEQEIVPDIEEVWARFDDPYEQKERVHAKVQSIAEDVLIEFGRISADTAVAKAAREYLEGKGFHLKEAELLDIRYDSIFWNIIFPVRNYKGELVYLSTRKIGAKRIRAVTAESTIFAGNKKFSSLAESGAFFGEHLINPEKPVLVIESEIELGKLKGFGVKNIIASLGGIKGKQLQRLLRYPTLILGFDDDDAGHRSRDKVIEKCQNYSVIYTVNWGDIGANDPGDIASIEELKIVLGGRKHIWEQLK